MRIPALDDKLRVVVAAVGRQLFCCLQQLRLTLIHLFEYLVPLDNIRSGSLGQLERNRKFMRGIHDEVQFVSEPFHNSFPCFAVRVNAAVLLLIVICIRVASAVRRLAFVLSLGKGRYGLTCSLLFTKWKGWSGFWTAVYFCARSLMIFAEFRGKDYFS